MSVKFVSPIDLNGLEILNALVQNLAAAPAHAEGRIYYDTVLNALRVSDGTNWVTLGEGGAGGAVSSVNTQTGDVVLDADDIGDGTTKVIMTTGERSKLAGVEAGAEVNNLTDPQATALTGAADTSLHFHAADRDRANHTGTQASTTISDFVTAVNALADAKISALVDAAPGTLDTLNELAAALGDDPNFATTVTTGLNTKNETFTQAIGNGSLTSIAVTHNLGTRAVTVALYETGAPYAVVYPEVRYTDLNTVTFIFATAPTSNQYTAVIQG